MELMVQWHKESACQCRRLGGSIPVLGRSPGEGNGNPFQCPCLRKSMDRGAWQSPVHGVAKESDMTNRLNTKITTKHHKLMTTNDFIFKDRNVKKYFTLKMAHI